MHLPSNHLYMRLDWACRAALVIAAAAAAWGDALVVAGEVRKISPELRQSYQLSPFYAKAIHSRGVLFAASELVSDFAVREAEYLVSQVLSGCPNMWDVFADAGLRVVVMAPNEWTTDVPEHSHLRPARYWDRRARGLGGTRRNPVVSCGEENLLNYAGDPYDGENILIHEFAHAVHSIGMRSLDPEFDARLRAAYQSAIDNGLWENTYAASNHSEYWAEGTQVWFECNAPPGRVHNDIRTRAQLRQYDPSLTALLGEVYGDNDWTYTRPDQSAQRSHLVGFVRDSTQRFRWPADLRNDQQEPGETAVSD